MRVYVARKGQGSQELPAVQEQDVAEAEGGEMTGAWVRIQRGDKWMNVEIDQLTDAELDMFAEQQGIERGWVWAKSLAKYIRDNFQAVTP